MSFCDLWFLYIYNICFLTHLQIYKNLYIIMSVYIHMYVLLLSPFCIEYFTLILIFSGLLPFSNDELNQQ